uniref:NADH-ubiquinone oxidoreductase chain 2 n=1 Tax=Madachauliodes sp. TaxID=2900212 RepID=A0A8K1T895_9NEOP|nr:NADH dehydrogenase subunit 2 [Madachauliodes sp.]
MLNISKMIFMLSMFMGTIMAISSSSWLGAWMGLEINLLAFIPLMSNLNNLLTNESALKYFLIQALASSMLLFSVIMSFFNPSNFFMLNMTEINQIMVNFSLFIKMGAAPFHFWFPSVMSGLNWINSLLLMTWQKIAPLILVSYSMNYYFFIIVIFFSAWTGAIGGLNQTNLRTLMAFSSINHLSWILSSMLVSELLWLIYFVFYSFLSMIMVYFWNNFKIYSIHQMYNTLNFNFMIKFLIMINLLSLGGLPPFLGFIPKLLVTQFLSIHQMYLMMTFLVLCSLITLFFYMRITFSAMMIMYPTLKNNKFSIFNNFTLTLGLSSLSILGFSSISLIYSFL